jgi:hypothetical protein
MQSEFIKKVMPLIESAANAARDYGFKVTDNVHTLYSIYSSRKSLLTDAAYKIEKEGTASPDRFTKPLTAEEFEQYLLSNGVWVDPEE